MCLERQRTIKSSTNNEFSTPALRHETMLFIFRPKRVTDKIPDRKSTRLNSSHRTISYAVFCLKKKNLLDYHEFFDRYDQNALYITIFFHPRLEINVNPSVGHLVFHIDIRDHCHSAILVTNLS